MKSNRFYNFLVFILLLSGSTINASAQNITADAKLDSLTIRIGDQTKLRLIVHQPAKEKVNFPNLADTISGKVPIVSSRMDTIVEKDNKGRITVIKSYTITSFDQGTYTIPSYNIGSSAGVLTTPQLTLMVQTVKVDTTKAIYDIKQPIAVSYTFFDWLKDHKWWILLGLVVIGGGIYLYLYLKKRPKATDEVKVIEPAVPAHVIALTKLQQLRERKLWQQEAVKEYYSELTDILREYLERRYDIKTHERTTEEIIASLKHMAISNEYRIKLNEVLTLADLVKFAKAKPLPVDNELSMENAIAFVHKTQETAQLQPQAAEGGAEHV
ncbi:hypothetical protein [Mucilaginibacter sp. L3T2-6]|uniref:hypothetical protein n=1 Tax=Mucilaginibacter sp. L3T2-6 TaxID=3062491 RepID=UPI002676F788|nr:hypothetical protein [Mucilaginibacter sp. L3T2-6]MDO3640863.1 hypothetical protein [Mucilaginibacter sp. L3T2-6]MDV6213661.1 hypothetical protein [Mucilaginibacter sp. L3T2-6]